MSDALPILTNDEVAILAQLAPASVRTIGRKRIAEVLTIAEKLHKAARDAQAGEKVAQFMTSAMWLAATGQLKPEEILAHPFLEPVQRQDLLRLLQLHYDAQAWNACTPAAEPAAPIPDPVFPSLL